MHLTTISNLQFTMIEPFNYIRELCGNTIKVYAWDPGMATSLFLTFSPERMGGMGNVHVKAEEEAARSGRSYKEVALEVRSVPIVPIDQTSYAYAVYE